MRELDLAAIRARLSAEGGRTYWRSLEELAATPEFVEMLHREFPEQASEFTDPAGRRQFLKLMGASMALAGVTGCTRQPPERIVPYVRAPEEIIPGRPLYFATALPFAGAGTPVLVESHMGRPTKIEPNTEHPSVHTGSDVFAQASILTLYDPDRAQAIKNGDDIRPWGQCLQVLQGAMNAQRALKGAGLRLLTETVTSPTLHAQITALLTDLPDAKWIQWEPAARDQVREGARLAFGEYVEPQYAFSKADIVLSLDADFLVTGPGHLRWAADFVEKRRLVGDSKTMNRLYVVESSPSSTGIKADHRLAIKAGFVEEFARSVAALVGVSGAVAAPVPGVPEPWLAALVTDLQQHRGASIVVAGEQQPAAVHALAHAINEALGNVGTTVAYTRTVESRPANQLEDLRALAADMEAGKVDLLVLIGESNPAYSAPADLEFARRLEKVGLRVQASLFEDETARLCHWHVPATHPLEAWSDTRSFDGTVSIVQPLIAPLYECRSPHELLVALSSTPDRKSYDVVRDFWKGHFDGRAAAFGNLEEPSGGPHENFDEFWRHSTHDGFIPGSAFAPTMVTLRPEAATATSVQRTSPTTALEVVFRPDPKVWDGRFANNGWLQELPNAVTKITWDNVALVSPATAERLGIRSAFAKSAINISQASDIIELKVRGNTVRIPAWIVPGQADESLMVTIGYGRTRAGRVGDGVGTDVQALRSSNALWHAPAEVARTGGTSAIACTQHHFALEGRNHIRAATLAHYQEEPEFAHHMAHNPRTT